MSTTEHWGKYHTYIDSNEIYRLNLNILKIFVLKFLLYTPSVKIWRTP